MIFSLKTKNPASFRLISVLYGDLPSLAGPKLKINLKFYGSKCLPKSHRSEV